MAKVGVKKGRRKGIERRRKSDIRGLCARHGREVGEVARARIVVNVFIRKI